MAKMAGPLVPVRLAATDDLMSGLLVGAGRRTPTHKSAHGTSASVGRAEHTGRSDSRGWSGPSVELPRSFPPTLSSGVSVSPQPGLETALLAGRPHRGMGSRQRL